MSKRIIPGRGYGYKNHHKPLIIDRLLSGRGITQAIFCDMTSKASRLAPRILELRQAIRYRLVVLSWMTAPLSPIITCQQDLSQM